jgi:hypothetical protein
MKGIKYAFLIVIIPSFAGSIVVAHAALTLGGNGISGTAGVTLDTTATISIGTSSATGITIGNANANITISGPVTISPTTTIQNLITSGLTISGLGASTQCLHVNAAGIVSGTGFDCGSGNGGASFSLASTSTIVSAYNIGAWGDSLTVGNEDGSGITYPNELALLEPGTNVTNFGVGGQTSTAITNRFLAASNTWPWYTLIWSGRNNYTSTNTVENDINTMVAQLPNPKQFIVMSILNGEYGPTEQCGGTGLTDIQQINNYLAATYSNNYLDIRSFLVNQYNPSIGADVVDYDNCVLPQSLRAVDNAGTITQNITATTTSFTVNYTQGSLAQYQIMNVGSEKIMITGISGGSTITSAIRGYGSTTAASYSSGQAFTGIDNIHLSGAGYTLIAQQVAAKMAAIASTTPTLVTSELLPQFFSSTSSSISNPSGTPPIYQINATPNQTSGQMTGSYLTLNGSLVLPNGSVNSGIYGFYSDGVHNDRVLTNSNGLINIGGTYVAGIDFSVGQIANYIYMGNCPGTMTLSIATAGAECGNALLVNGSVQLSASSTVVTPSIGGSSLSLGACSSATSSIDTSVTTSSAAFITTPERYLNPGTFDWSSQVIAPGVLETDVCAKVAGTPTSTPFNVKILK